MQPFLKKTKEASVAAPVDHVKREPDSEIEADYDSLESAAADLFEAFRKNDAKMGAAALRAAFELADSEPHHEGPYLEGSG